MNLRICTVLDGLLLAGPLSPKNGVWIVPLPFSTADLPRLPIHRDATPQDYLGLSLLKVQLSVSPALFRPDMDAKDGAIRSSFVDGVCFELMCDALSLQANSHVSPSILWYEQRPNSSPWRSESRRCRSGMHLTSRPQEPPMLRIRLYSRTQIKLRRYSLPQFSRNCSRKLGMSMLPQQCPVRSAPLGGNVPCITLIPRAFRKSTNATKSLSADTRTAIS